ncbi:hypothetical protein MKX01_017311 [Papaver californicum]|nr:hypothetical protein MKX01_017311 [Papaver californicum]
MSDNLMEKVSAFGEKLKIEGVETGKKMTAGMNSMSFKMKELFQGGVGGSNQADKFICDMINSERINSVDFIRGIKKRIVLKNPRVQYLTLVLLETCVKNCEKAFSEVAAERVLDEMVKLIDDPQTVVNNRNKALILIEAWGESANELRYLPVYEETYKYSSHEVHEHQVPMLSAEQTKEEFNVARNSIELLSTVLSSSPQQDVLQDDLTTTLFQQCHQSQLTVRRIIETAGDNEAVLFEALNINGEIQKVLSKYEELNKPFVAHAEAEPAMVPVAVEPDEKSAGSRIPRGGESDDMMDDLDEMIFGKKSGCTSEAGQDGNKKPSQPKDDLISF